MILCHGQTRSLEDSRIKIFHMSQKPK